MYNYKKFNKFLKFFFFKYGMTDKTLGNFTEKVQSVKKILHCGLIEILHTLVKSLLLRL
jgi:hypothetical protein